MPNDLMPLWLRHSLRDTGPAATAGGYASPDVVYAGTDPVDNPARYLADASWLRAYHPPALGDQPQCLYVRGTNTAERQVRGVVRLYAVPAPFTLWPNGPGDATGWLAGAVATAGGADHIVVEAEAGARFVTAEPFVLPARQAGGEVRMAYVALATPDDAPLPRDWTLAEVQAFFADRRDVGAVNVGYVGSRFRTTTFETRFAIGPLGGEVYVFLKTLHAPEGSLVAMRASDPGPNPPLAVDETRVRNTQGKDGPTFIAALNTDIPAGYASPLSWSWHPNWTWAGPTMTLTLEAVLVLPATAPAAATLTVETAAGPQPGLLIGTQTLIWPDDLPETNEGDSQ